MQFEQIVLTKGVSDENVVSISNARKELPKMMKKLLKNPEKIYVIKVRDEVIAEIRSAKKQVESGEAVRKLIHLRNKLAPLIKGKSEEPISGNVKKHVYGKEGG